MNIRPSLEEVRQIAAAGTYDVLPVSTEILSDFTTPIETLRILKNVSKHCFLLESAQADETWGRYTFLGFDPKLDITCVGGEINGVLDAGRVKYVTGNPADYLREVLSRYKSPRFDYLPPFTGGLMGYFSYDYLGYSEPSVRVPVEDTEHFRDVDLMLFDQVIAFDHIRQKIVLISNMELNDPETNYNKAVWELKQLRDLLRSGQKKIEPGGHLTGGVTALFDQARFCAMVEKAKDHIREGDIFQIVLSNRLSAPFEGSLLNTYRLLRTINPSPYMFYFSGTDVEVAGASPETLVKLEDGILHTFPLAGTRPRGKTEAAGRRKGAGRAQHAGGSGQERPGKNQPFRHRAGGEAALGGAVLPRDAHRLHGARRDPRRLRRPGRHCGGPARGHPLRGPEDPGMPAHRRAGGQQARHLRRRHRLHRLHRQYGHLHRHPPGV